MLIEAKRLDFSQEGLWHRYWNRQSR